MGDSDESNASKGTTTDAGTGRRGVRQLLVPVVLVAATVCGSAAYAGTRTVLWCEWVRADQMAQLERTAHHLFDPVAEDLGVSANCGGDSDEYYPNADASIRAREAVSPREIEALLLEAGWESKYPNDRHAQDRYYSPDGAYEVTVSWVRTPEVDYPFLGMALRVSDGR
jgi:hypothetical protein